MAMAQLLGKIARSDKIKKRNENRAKSKAKIERNSKWNENETKGDEVWKRNWEIEREKSKDEIRRWSMKTKLEARESNLRYLKRWWRKFPWDSEEERWRTMCSGGGRRWRVENDLLLWETTTLQRKAALHLWDSEEVRKKDGRCATAVEDDRDTTTTKESNTALRQHSTDTLMFLKH